MADAKYPAMVRGSIHIVQVEHGKSHAYHIFYCMHRWTGRETTALQPDVLSRSTRERLHVYMIDLGLDAFGWSLTFLACESPQTDTRSSPLILPELARHSSPSMRFESGADASSLNLYASR